MYRYLSEDHTRVQVCRVIDERVTVFAHFEVGVVPGIGREVRAEYLCSLWALHAVAEQPAPEVWVCYWEVWVGVEGSFRIDIGNHEIDKVGFWPSLYNKYGVDGKISNFCSVNTQRTVEVDGYIQWALCTVGNVEALFKSIAASNHFLRRIISSGEGRNHIVQVPSIELENTWSPGILIQIRIEEPLAESIQRRTIIHAQRHKLLCSSIILGIFRIGRYR